MMELKNLSLLKGLRLAKAKKEIWKLYKTMLRADKKFWNAFDLSVVIAPNNLMRKLNRKYRKKNVPANVLSFLIENKTRGEIFLNSAENNLAFLFLHGAMHLKGYEHRNIKDAEKMESIEKSILKK